jgi:hypothetical protein
MFASLFLLRLNLVPATAAILEIPSQDELRGRAHSSSLQSVDTIYSGAPGQTVTLTLSQLVLTGNERLTLQGTMTTHFVIDINEQFSLFGHSSIVLSGGIQWNDVIFNLIGRGAKMIMRGHTQMTGIIDAPERRVTLTGHALVVGEVRARRVDIRRFARIKTPPIISP